MIASDVILCFSTFLLLQIIDCKKTNCGQDVKMSGTLTTVVHLLNTSIRNGASDVTGGGDGDGSYSAAYSQQNVTYMLWHIVPPVLLVLGCFGNVMTIVVMRGMRASESTACLSVYFTALALSDLCLLLTSMIWFWPEMAFDTPVAYFHDLSCAVPWFVTYVTAVTSAWFLMAMTGQRLLSVLVPHRVGVLCTVRRGKLTTVTIFIAACLFNLYIIFNNEVKVIDNQYKICASIDEYNANIHRMAYLLVTSFIPFLFLIFANSVLIYHVIQSLRSSRKMTATSEHQKSSRSAKVPSMMITLILTSVAFLILTLPVCVSSLYLEIVGFYKQQVEDEELNQILAIVDTVCLLLWNVNSSVNFYIYVLSGSRFRRETKRQLSLLFSRCKARPETA